MHDRSERIVAAGLLILPIAAAWLFVPTFANAFQVKQYLITTGILLLALASFALPSRVPVCVPKGIAGSGLLLLFVAGSLSALAAGNGYLALTAWIELVAFMLLVAILFSQRDVNALQRAFETGLIVAAGGVGLFALKQFFLPGFLDPGFHALGKMKIYSTLGNPNLAAHVLMPALPVTLYRGIRTPGLHRALYFALLMVQAGGLLATQSRHALLATLVMAVVALLWLGSTRVRRITLATLAVGALIALAWLAWTALPPSVAHSVKGRWFVWRTAWEMFLNQPWLGVGLGGFGLHHLTHQAGLFASGGFSVYFDNAALIEEAHNQFLHWGATAGAGGLIGFTALTATALWQGWRSAAVRAHAPHVYLALAGSVFAMLFVATLFYATVALLFWALLALVLRRAEAPMHALPLSRTELWVVLAAVMTLLAVSLWWGHREMRAGYFEARGDRHMEERDLWQAGRQYRNGLDWHPEHGKLRKKYATTLYLEGRHDEALRELALARRSSGDIAIRILEGEILTRDGRLDEATEVYRQISAAFPKMVSPRFILGQIYVLQGRRDEAAAEFGRILEIEPSPYNLNLTGDKVELQKEIARRYLREQANAARP